MTDTGGSRRVLVCGGRDYKDAPTLYWTLGKLHEKQPIAAIIAGGAHGADEMAEHWAFRRSIATEIFEADWKTHGRAAGPIRNQRMIDEGKPDLVVAFHGGRGTLDLVKRARAARIEVIQVPSLSGSPG